MKRIGVLICFCMLVILLTGCDEVNDLVDLMSGSGDDTETLSEKIDEDNASDSEEDDNGSEQSGESQEKDEDNASDSEKDDNGSEQSGEDEDSETSTSSKYEKKFHHTTTGSSDGGKSLVMCSGQIMNFDSCKAGGVTIPNHGYDNGREIYWNMKKEPEGDIVCVKDGESYKYKADKTIVYGDCD